MRERRVSYLSAAAKKIVADLVELQPRTASVPGLGATRDEYIGVVVADLQSKQPAPFDVPIVRKKLVGDKAGVVAPVTTVLLQELDHWNALLGVIDHTLRELQKARAKSLARLVRNRIFG